MKNILLTGASGFIGKHFLKAYKHTHSIHTFSLQHNTLNSLQLDTIDIVIHLAALVHQMKGAPKDEYHSINFSYPLALAKKAKECGVKQFIFMSSVKVYGEENKDPYTEQSPCHPLDAYGQSKRDAEKALLSLSNTSFKVSIIRTPVVYGEGVKANILKLIQLTDNYCFLPFGGIANKRSMIYVGNLIHLMSEVIRQEKEGIFLASDNMLLSTTGLIKKIANSLGKSRWVFKCITLMYLIKLIKPSIYERLFGDLYLDNSDTVKRLNLTNPYTTQEGIRNMTIWYKEKFS